MNDDLKRQRAELSDAFFKGVRNGRFYKFLFLLSVLKCGECRIWVLCLCAALNELNRSSGVQKFAPFDQKLR